VRAEQEANASPNVKAKLEIEPLHAKIDALREQEIVKLTTIIERLSAHLTPGLVACIEAKGGAVVS
jgi:uncharacterized membrane protein